MNTFSNLHPQSNRLLPLFFILLFLPRLLSGQTAIPLTAGSFDHDAVEEAGCASAMSMDASNHAFDGSVGWPVSLNYTYGSNPYVLRPYSGFNAQQVLSSSSTTLTLASPTQLANLHFLLTSTEGASTATYTVNFTDATTQTLMTATTPDWVIGGGVYISDARSIGTCIVKGPGHLFEASGNISPANYGKTVSSITVSRGAGGGRLYIFGASSCGAGPYFTTCPNNISIGCPGPVSYTANTSGASSVSYSFSGATSGSGSGTGSGSSFNYGTTTVTLTATNSCGSQTCIFTVTVGPDLTPSIVAVPTLPKTIVTLGRQSTYSNVQLNGGTNFLSVAPSAPVTLTGNYSYSYAGGGGCPGCVTQHYVGIQGVFWDCHFAGDAGHGSGSGNINTSFTAPAAPGVYYITQSGSWCFNCGDCVPTFPNSLTDAIAVLVVGGGSGSCLANITVNNTPGQCGAVVTYPALTAVDNCSGATLSQTGGYASGQSFPVGTTTNIFVATDASGNTSSCSFTVTVVDNQPPTALCQNATVNLTQAGTASISATAINNGSFDNCGSVSLSPTQFNFFCNYGQQTVTLTVTDLSGNTATCTATVTVSDPIGPAFEFCPGNIVVNNDPGQCNARVCYPSPRTYDDNCPPLTPAGYTYFNQNGAGTNNTKYYYFSNTLTNYATATANARAAGGHLAVITSAAEQAHIPPGVRWLGGSDALIEGTFQWETCEPFGYTNWAAGEPNNQSGIEDHMATWTGGFWNDVNVAGPYGSVLEIEGVRFVQTTGLPQNAVFPVGTTTNTFVATDAAGNTASCQFTVTVNDNTPPTITCPGNISVNVTPGLCTAPVGYPAVTGADNCSFTISRIGGLASGSLFPVGVTTNTFVATDASGNTASCQFTVTVSDNQPPTAVCQNITVPLAGASVTITASQINNGSSDLCGGITLSVIPTTFNCNQVGQNLVALTVTDASGNTAQCFSQVTVVDNTPPTAVCQNIPVALVGASANIIAAQINGGSSDNCSYTLSASPTSFNCSNVGPNTVALTVTDMSGNTATCNATVTVVDNTLPVANCNDNVTVALSGASVTITAAEIDENSSDNCSFSLSVSPSTFDCSDVGANTVTLTVTDASGNTATCFSVVNVVDNTPPSAICQNVTVTLDAMGNGSTTAAAVNNGSNDACGIASMSLSQTSFNCSNVGLNNVTLTVTDNNGNTSACTATVNVVDNTPPVAICQPVTVYLNALGIGTTSPGAVDNGSNDACGIQSQFLSQAVFTCSNIGSNTITLTVTDVNGNTSACTATVTVVDNVPPVAICQNVTVNLNASGNGTTTAAAVNNGSSDACGIGSLALSQTSFNCSNVGANSVTLTVTDVNGNTATCTTTVTVVDNVPPVAVCQNVTVYLNASGNGTTTAAAVNNGSSDACGIASLALSQTSFNCSNVGANSVTLTVTDVNGNTATCTATVTVVDNVPPVAICQNVTVYLNASGNGTTTAAAVNNGSSDACGIASLALSQTSFNCSNVGANSVTLTVTDVNGNSSTCTATVTVVDNIPPVAICKSATAYLNAAGTVTITPADVFFSGSDNCGTVNLVSVSPNTFTCSNVGANSVTLNVNDGHGNTSICTATVTVVDNLLPTIACPGPITVDNAPGLCSAPVSYTVTASDNCAYTITQTGGLASGQQFPVGTTTNIWKVTDASGNTATCSFTVTVLKIGDPGLLFAYTVIGFDEVKMKTNTVQSGGVGVVNSGKKAKLEHATMVTAANTFVKAPILDLNGGSMVTTYHPGQVSASLLPAFQPNTAPCNNDVNIADNSGPVTLGLACYGKITVGKNVNVTFSGHAVVTAKELKLKEGSAAFFAQSTNLRLDKKLDTDKYVDISNNGHNVWIFAEDHVKIDDGNNVTANIYCQKHIHVDKTPAGNPTYMTGLFIAEKVDSKENVFWNWDPAFCPGAPPPPSLVANVNALTFYAERKGLTTKLQWFTRSGQTNDHFIVERSVNQLDWHPVLKVDGEGPADELMVFNETDLDPLSGDNFYRLRLVSKDGSERFSDVRKVVFPDGFLSVYPNPNGGDVLYIALSEFAGQPARIEISDPLGHVLDSKDFDELPNEEIAWNTTRFAVGSYFISVKIPGERMLVKRFVVQRL